MPRPFLWLSLLLAALVTAAGAAGIFLEGTYAMESASWAAQGIGQDIVTLTLVVPLLIVSAIKASRGSKPALLVWAGVLVYLAYSYTLYAFFIHFNALFLVYTAALGLSFYLLAFGIALTNRHALIVEDILDTGHTLDYLTRMIRAREAKSLRTCVLLRKLDRVEVEVPIDYLGFDIPDVWVVGYGLDYADRFRTLPYIAALKRQG